MQVLLDRERFERLEEESRRRNQSVGATVRDAIDLLLDTDDDGRLAARRQLLTLPTGDQPEAVFNKNALLDAAAK